MDLKDTLYSIYGFIILAIIIITALILIYYVNIENEGMKKSKQNKRNEPANVEKLDSVAGMVKKLYEDKEFMDYLNESSDYNSEAIYT